MKIKVKSYQEAIKILPNLYHIPELCFKLELANQEFINPEQNENLSGLFYTCRGWNVHSTLVDIIEEQNPLATPVKLSNVVLPKLVLKYEMFGSNSELCNAANLNNWQVVSIINNSDVLTAYYYGDE